MDACLEKMRSFCRKTMSIKFLVLGGGVFWVLGGGGRFYFYGRTDFSDFLWFWKPLHWGSIEPFWGAKGGSIEPAGGSIESF